MRPPPRPRGARSAPLPGLSPLRRLTEAAGSAPARALAGEAPPPQAAGCSPSSRSQRGILRVVPRRPHVGLVVVSIEVEVRLEGERVGERLRRGRRVALPELHGAEVAQEGRARLRRALIVAAGAEGLRELHAGSGVALGAIVGGGPLQGGLRGRLGARLRSETARRPREHGCERAREREPTQAATGLHSLPTGGKAGSLMAPAHAIVSVAPESHDVMQTSCSSPGMMSAPPLCASSPRALRTKVSRSGS